ncbi:PqiC family protein [Ostreibacterium oceani]|nr:PqiC family protein [Ostreibacterium oceani]
MQKSIIAKTHLLRLLRLISIAVSLVIAGCASAPPIQTYYVLSHSPTANISDISGQPDVSIRRVTLPNYLNQKGIVRMQQNGKVHLSLTDIWADRLSDAIPTILARNIEATKQSPVEVHPLPPGISVDTIVEVDIQQLISEASINNSNQLTLVAKYRLVKPKHLDSYNFSTHIPLSDTSTVALVDAHNQALEALALDIAKHL